GGETEVGGIGLSQTLVYLTIANLQLYFLRPEVSGDIQSRIREGQIGFDLSRPVGYPSQLIAGAAGDMLGLLPMIVVSLPVALIVGELKLPPSAMYGAAYLVSFLLAWVIAVQLNMMVGLISFWTLEMTGFEMIYRLIGNFATGALVPLWFMPDALRAVIQLLPFQSIAFIPVSIYVGAPATGAIWSALAVQVFWAVALIGIIQWIWSKAFRHTVIQGG
ncbi:MAG TPA: ABC-2 family transporter protein, partial [Thermomicrobiales bacterium]|nr:ABC-2 family transporter protein [Thermomicrobiales bacterium]